MVTLHSFDEEPQVAGLIHAFDHDFIKRITFKCFGDGSFELLGSQTEYEWLVVKRSVKKYKGWLYESELMQCVKNGTRSE